MTRHLQTPKKDTEKSTNTSNAVRQQQHNRGLGGTTCASVNLVETGGGMALQIWDVSCTRLRRQYRKIAGNNKGCKVLTIQHRPNYLPVLRSIHRSIQCKGISNVQNTLSVSFLYLHIHSFSHSYIFFPVFLSPPCFTLFLSATTTLSLALCIFF